MTIASRVEPGLQAPLLRIVADVSSDLTLFDFSLCHLYLHRLAVFCGAPEQFEGIPAPRSGSPDIIFVRSSMASPWVAVLGELAKGGTPIAYGIGTIFVLERLLKMIMDWQNHRRALQTAVKELDPEILLRQHIAETAGEPVVPGYHTFSIEAAADALSNFPHLRSVELVDEDDERNH